MNKQKQIILWIIILLLLIWWVKTQIYITKLNKQNIELQNKANRKSEIELTKEQIKQTTSEVKVLSETIEKLQKDYELKVWTRRCLETKWEIELKSMSWTVDCTKNLEEFSADNFENTRVEMGL